MKKISVAEREVCVDHVEPRLIVWEIEVKDGIGTYHASFGSERDKDTFIHGLRTGLSLMGYAVTTLDVTTHPFKDKY